MINKVTTICFHQNILISQNVRRPQLYLGIIFIHYGLSKSRTHQNKSYYLLCWCLCSSLIQNSLNFPHFSLNSQNSIQMLPPTWFLLIPPMTLCFSDIQHSIMIISHSHLPTEVATSQTRFISHFIVASTTLQMHMNNELVKNNWQCLQTWYYSL